MTQKDKTQSDASLERLSPLDAAIASTSSRLTAAAATANGALTADSASPLALFSDSSRGRRRRAMILCGGQSPEHAVSLVSGRCCAHSLDRDRWDVDVACILTDGRWALPRRPFGPADAPADVDKLFDILELPDYCPRGYLRLAGVGEAMEYLSGPERPDVIFPVTHGTRGEDGRLQGLLDFLRIPYAGSGVMASALAMDKTRALEIVEYHGVRAPARLVIGPGRLAWNPERFAQIVAERLGWPVFVKPARGGSSLGAAPASTPTELEDRVMAALALDDTVLIEERITGIEVTCAVIEIAGRGVYGGAGAAGEGPEPGAAGGMALHRVVCPPTEIVPRSAEFFDFDSKYRPGASEEITPARVEPEVMRRIQETAERAHLALGCRGLSRSDMIVTPEGEPVYLETNTLPGMTPTSLLPQGARALGLDLTQLLNTILETCLALSESQRASVG